MDRDAMMKTMREAISNVLDIMFFQPVQIADSDCTLQEWLSQEQSLLGATLRFDGSVSGLLYLLIPVAMASEITANFLGLRQEEINEEQKRDTIKEAINMIGGHMLALFDRKGAFKLGIPGLIEEGDLTEHRLGDLKVDMIPIETGEGHLAVGIAID